MPSPKEAAALTGNNTCNMGRATSTVGTDIQHRRRMILHGLDSRLLGASADEITVPTAEQESLVRRSAYVYGEALRAIRDELAGASPDSQRVLALAAAALASPLRTGPQLLGKHISFRMCQWLTRDRYIDLSRIVDAGVLGENVLEVAAKRVKSAFAGIELR